MREQSAGELFDALLALDQQYPNRLALKVNIGGMLLASGDLPKASAYLHQGLRLVSRSRDRKMRFLLFASLAELSYREKRFDQGLQFADRALKAGEKDAIGVIFTKGKCLKATGKGQEAMEAFQLGWNENRQGMSKEDLSAYADLLLGHQKYEETLQVLKQYEAGFGYELSLGLQEAAILKILDRTNEEVLAAFKDLEYQRSLGLISSAQQIERLDGWKTRGSAESKMLLSALRQYVFGNWADAARGIAGVELKEQVIFRSYLVHSARLEMGSTSSRDLQSYISLEPHLRGLPAYYYHLWRGMKKSHRNYTFATVRKVLEKCILLAPQTQYARETRAETGLLLGLSGKDGQKILLGPELDFIFRQLQTGAPVDVLEPVLRLLDTPDNVYEVTAVLLLQEAGKQPAIREYLQHKRGNATGRLKERLTAILGLEPG